MTRVGNAVCAVYTACMRRVRPSASRLPGCTGVARRQRSGPRALPSRSGVLGHQRLQVLLLGAHQLVHLRAVLPHLRRAAASETRLPRLLWPRDPLAQRRLSAATRRDAPARCLAMPPLRRGCREVVRPRQSALPAIPLGLMAPCVPGRWASPGCRTPPPRPARAGAHQLPRGRAGGGWARAWQPSTSTLKKASCGYLPDSSSKNGAIILHGPHHVAVKSTTTWCAARARRQARGTAGPMVPKLAKACAPPCRRPRPRSASPSSRRRWR